MSRRAVFFDRDGTLCREVGYVNDPDRLELAPHAADAIRRVNDLGWDAICVTNQAGAARGYFPYHLIEVTHERLGELLAMAGARLDDVFTCPHHPDLGGPELRMVCSCRKPKPGLLESAATRRGLDLSRCFLVGDSFRDIRAGRAAGVSGTVLLRSGYGRGELLGNSRNAKVWPDLVADDLLAAVDWIVKVAKRRQEVS